MGIISSTALWYASRATGVVALVLLTAVVVLGILVNRRGRLPGLPRFATTSLHRSMSLLAVAFLAVHVVTAIADPYVTIGIAAAVVPFAAAYKTFWIGLGAVSLDIIIALTITSLARPGSGTAPGAQCTAGLRFLADRLVARHWLEQRLAIWRPACVGCALHGGGHRRRGLADCQHCRGADPGAAGWSCARGEQREPGRRTKDTRHWTR